MLDRRCHHRPAPPLHEQRLCFDQPQSTDVPKPVVDRYTEYVRKGGTALELAALREEIGTLPPPQRQSLFLLRLSVDQGTEQQRAEIDQRMHALKMEVERRDQTIREEHQSAKSILTHGSERQVRQLLTLYKPGEIVVRSPIYGVRLEEILSFTQTVAPPAESAVDLDEALKAQEDLCKRRLMVIRIARENLEIGQRNLEDTLRSPALSPGDPREILVPQLAELRNTLTTLQRREKHVQDLLEALSSQKQSGTDAEKGVLNAVGWNRLTQQQKTTVKATGAAAGLALGSYLLYRLWKGTKRVASAGAEKVKSGLSWLWGAALVAGVGVAGFIGWKALEKKLDEKLAPIRGAIDKGRELAERGRDGARDLVDKGREKIEQARQDGTVDRARQDAEALSRLGAKGALPSAVVRFNGNDVDWGAPIEDEAKTVKVASVISALSQGDRPVHMARVFDCLTGNSVDQNKLRALYTPPPDIQRNPEDAKWHEKALEVFVLFCARHRDRLQRLYVRHPTRMPDLSTQTVQEFVEKGCGTYEAIGLLTSLAKKRGRSLLDPETIEQFEQQMKDLKDQQLDVVMLDLVPDVLRNDAFRDLSAGEVLKAALAHHDVHVSQYVANMGARVAQLDAGRSLADLGISRADVALFRICRHIQAHPPDIKGFFHGVYPESDFRGTDEERMRRYLTSDMPLSTAVRLALYERMGKQGNALGYVLSQVEVLRFLRQNDTSKYLNSRVYKAATKLVGKLTPEGLRASLEEYVENKDQVDPMITQIVSTLKPVGEALAMGLLSGAGEVGSAAWGGVEAGAEAAWEFAKDHPVIDTEIAAGTAVSLKAAGIHFDNPARFNKSLRAASLRRGKLAPLKWLTRSHRLIEARGAAANAMENLWTQLLKVHPAEGGSKGLDALYKFLHSGRRTQDLATLESEVQALCKALPVAQQADTLRDVTTALNVIKDSEGIQNTIRHHRFFHRLVSLPFRVVVGVPERIVGGTLKGSALLAQASWEWLRGPKLAQKIGASPHFQKALQACKTTAQPVLRVLTEVQMPDCVAKAFSGSYRALCWLVRAALGGGAPAVARLASSGSSVLSRLRLGPGGGFVAFDTALALWELGSGANQERIDATDDPLMKDIYGTKDVGTKARVGMGATYFAGIPLTEAGLKMAGIHGARVLGMELAAGGAAGLISFVGLPAIAAGEYVRGQAEAVAEKWLKDAKAWATQSEGELLQKLQEIGPGKHSYWDNYAYGTIGEQLLMVEGLKNGLVSVEDYRKWEEKGAKRIEDANAMTRYEVSRALAIKAAMANHVALPGEDDQQQRRRFDQHVMDQMDYLRHATQGGFDTANPDVFHQAKQHADLMALSRALKEEEESRVMTWEVNGKPVQFDIATYADLPASTWTQADTQGVSRGQILQQYALQSKVGRITAAIDLETGYAEQTVLATFLSDITLDLSRLEARIQETDFPGLFWANTNSQDLARYMAFKALTETLDQELEKILQTEDVTPQSYQAALHRVGAAINWPAMEYYKRGEIETGRGTVSKADVAKYEDRTDLLIPTTIMKEIFGEPPTATTSQAQAA